LSLPSLTALRARPWALVLALGLGFGIALWWVAPAIDGDALFHMARIRKLDAFGSLHLRTVDEFRDGGLHPGYAFPLWHVLLALAAGALALAVVHPTYAIFVVLPLAGYVVARLLLARRELVRGVVALAATVVPAGAFALWLLPLVRETAGHNPGPAERARGLRHYADQLDVFSPH